MSRGNVEIVPPSSRAGSLPQGNRIHLQEIGWLSGRLREQARSHNGSPYTRCFHHSSGRALARLQLLILIHPPHRKAERRCSSGGWRAAPFDAVEPIACRCSEANRRAMPPDECRSEGTPSSSEGPDAGARPLLPLGRLPKGVGRQGETISSRYRSNGYVLSQQKTGRLSGRLRGQATLPQEDRANP
jgi:hypothetical protein